MRYMKIDRRRRYFRRWFTGSAVVDSLGRPLMVYHGTPARFQRFRTSEDGGFHFGDRAAAGWRLADLTGDEGTAGNRILGVYLAIQRPKLLDFDAGDASSWRKQIRQAKREGFDGIRYLNSVELDQDFNTGDPISTWSWVAFKPEQIKIVLNQRAPTLSSDA